MIESCTLVGRSCLLFLFSFSFLSLCRSSEEGVGDGKVKICIENRKIKLLTFLSFDVTN